MSTTDTHLPKRVSVAIDGDEHSLRAAAWAQQFADDLDAEIVAIAAVTNASAEHSPTDELRFEDETRDETTAWLHANDIEIDTVVVVEGELDDGIVGHTGPDDLVIIGAHHTEGFTRWALGSRPHDLAKRLTCPLILIPPLDPAQADAPIVVGLDSAETNQYVVAWAKALGAKTSHPIFAAYARNPMYDTFDSAGDKGPDERAARIAAETDDVELHERAGDASTVLRDVAHETNAYLTVVGARGEHSFHGLLLGDVVDHLMHEPPGPLAILNHDALE